VPEVWFSPAAPQAHESLDNGAGQSSRSRNSFGVSPACRRIEARGAALYRAMLGYHRHFPVLGAAVDGVAALDAHPFESGGLQSASHLPDRKVGQRRAHAAPGRRNEVTSGVLLT
jgi:hypothetical protein